MEMDDYEIKIEYLVGYKHKSPSEYEERSRKLNELATRKPIFESSKSATLFEGLI